ncbi:SRPBCC family protein [Mycolicibacterium sp. F2034L]|uniref:SRPBCC family protein n=1 Tax=Mycolicibacterium sp. F2034L TaxID=2926422 RepID=UPI001FF1D20F|nr:SRPBCC family protein [Mycolicibacterium sp. F2034L]MCK0173816.1 SRPBCC family protein [Mycolicibacterium sp. F2034L]
MVAEISRHRTVRAAPQAVWDLLADYGAVAEWVDDVDHSCILNAAEDGLTGTTRRVQIGRLVLVERVTEAEPLRTLAYDIAGLPGPVRHAANRWTLDEVLQGATQITLTSTIDLGPGRLREVIARVIARGMGRSSDSMLAGLATKLEAPA